MKNNKKSKIITNIIPELNFGKVAGGAIRAIFANEQICDIDLYLADFHEIALARTILENSGFVEIFKTENAITMSNGKDKVQIITKPEFVGLTNQEIFESFDFTVCMGILDLATQEFDFCKSFFLDLSSKNLAYNVKGKYPISSLIRVQKYIKKGYYISGIELLKIALRIHKLELDNYSVLKDQLNGVDTILLQPLTVLFETGGYKSKEYNFEEFLELLNRFDLDEIYCSIDI
jgi:hypothetical protein